MSSARYYCFISHSINCPALASVIFLYYVGDCQPQDTEIPCSPDIAEFQIGVILADSYGLNLFQLM